MSDANVKLQDPPSLEKDVSDRFSDMDVDSLSNNSTDDTSVVDDSAESFGAEAYNDIVSICRGNKAVQQSDFTTAKSLYQKGIKIIGKILKDDRATDLNNILNLNMSMACTKLSEYPEAIKAANAVLKCQPDNIKALFRRGIAASASGMLEEAKADMIKVVKLDPKNAPARKELKSIKEKIQAQNEIDRANYKDIFCKVGGIYDDREEENKIKKEKHAAQLLAEENEWKQSNEDRIAIGMAAQTKEEWLKSKNETVESQKQLNPSASQEVSQLKPKSPVLNDKTSNEDDHFDEEDLKIISETSRQGYCYFRRDVNDTDKKLLENEQKKLREISNELNGSRSVEVDRVIAGSDWNAAGTWEEKDKSEWAKSRLKTLLSLVAVQSGFDVEKDPASYIREMSNMLNANEGGAISRQLEAIAAKISVHVYKVENVEGDAHIIVVRGKKRVLFDITVTLKWKLTIEDELRIETTESDLHEKMKYRGTLTLTDVTVNDVENGSFENLPKISTSKSSWPKQYNERVAAVFDTFKQEIYKKFHALYEEMKSIP